MTGAADLTGAAGAAALARAEALAAPLPPLLAAAERVAATVTQGMHGRRRVGTGDSFWQFRPLLPGEGTARIDWRRSARSQGAHFVRQTEWEAAQTVVLWRADGASMAWRSLPTLPRKRERAELLLLALASILVRGGERVRLLGETIFDATNTAGLRRLALGLGDPATTAGPAAPAADPLPGLAAALARVPRHCGVVLIGDWLEPLEIIRAAIGGLMERQARGHVLQVLDPAEIDLPYAGRVRFRGVHDAAPSALVGRAEDIRDAYAVRLAAHQAGLASLCHGSGLSFSTHRTDHSAVSALLGLYSALAARTITG